MIRGPIPDYPRNTRNTEQHTKHLDDFHFYELDQRDEPVGILFADGEALVPAFYVAQAGGAAKLRANAKRLQKVTFASFIKAAEDERVASDLNRFQSEFVRRALASNRGRLWEIKAGRTHPLTQVVPTRTPFLTVGLPPAWPMRPWLNPPSNARVEESIADFGHTQAFPPKPKFKV